MERLLRVYRLRTGSALLCLATMVVGLAAVPAPAAQAQTGSIVGTVVDRATSQPLEGSLVTVVGTRLGANTDGRGHFVIRGVRPGHDSVLVRRIGYAPLGRSA
ncbi:MAG: carboxypeptidase regulatory-like domain-containing protein, partial [Gemmatimonadota bacterium]|nr:carboxypeptidase regulatory-like domain-containing protein [Gemmatimonadota bacterium]